MTLEIIKSKAQSLAQELSKIPIRRKMWNEVTKNLIFDTLTKIKNETSLDWYVQKIDTLINQEFVNLNFGKRPSGITEVSNEGSTTSSKSIVIKGGYIVYTQAVNGKIYVIISYPYVENIIHPIPPLTVACLEPNDINEGLIYIHIDKFLNEMLLWQNSSSNNGLGFKY